MIMDKPVSPACLFVTGSALEVAAQPRRDTLWRVRTVIVEMVHLWDEV